MTLTLSLSAPDGRITRVTLDGHDITAAVPLDIAVNPAAVITLEDAECAS